MKTEVLSIRVKKELKDDADRLGIDVRMALEKLLEEMIEVKKQRGKEIAMELSKNMSVTVKDWVNDVRNTRKEA
jgi:hypothetical protein